MGNQMEKEDVKWWVGFVGVCLLTLQRAISITEHLIAKGKNRHSRMDKKSGEDDSCLR